MTLRAQASRFLLVTLWFVASHSTTPQASASNVTYAFELKNNTNAAADDYRLTFVGGSEHLTVAGRGRVAATFVPADFSLSNSSLGWGSTVSIDQNNKSIATITWDDATGMKTLAMNKTQQFSFAVKNLNSISPTSSVWSDINSKDLAPGAGLPTLRVVDNRDPIVIFENDLMPSATFRLRNIQFAVNVPQMSPSSVSAALNSIFASSFNPSLPNFSLGPPTEIDVPGSVAFENFLYVSGQIVDSSGTVTGSFIYGVQPVPEPTSLVLLGTGILVLFGCAWRDPKLVA
jgi:hypothetical protein